MSFEKLLIHIVDIKEYTLGVKDAYGNSAKIWSDSYTDELCRLVSTTGREIKVGAEVVISDWKLFVDGSVVVTEQDRVSNIRMLVTGDDVDTDTFEILLVQPRSNGASEGAEIHHKELALRKVA